MRRQVLAIALAVPLFVTLAAAQDSTTPAPAARKDCEELKKEIAAKIEANGVKSYELNIVPNEEVKDQKVVGSCDGGTRKITYKRN